MKILSIEEKLALIEEANRLRNQYFSLLEYKNFLWEQRERFLLQALKTEDLLFCLNPIMQRTFSNSGTFQPNELLRIFDAIINLLTDFQIEFASNVLNKLHSLQIYFQEGENETNL